jgi:hypothetical protein
MTEQPLNLLCVRVCGGSLQCIAHLLCWPQSYVQTQLCTHIALFVSHNDFEQYTCNPLDYST